MGVSDHADFVRDTGVKMPFVHRISRFELCWFKRPEVFALVGKMWRGTKSGRNKLDFWHLFFVNTR